MEPSEVTEIIGSEVAGDWSHSNAHGVDLKRCLVFPVKQLYENPVRNSTTGTIELWLVLEESPERKSGYKIVFDEKSRKFGLAIKDTQNKNAFLGFYGTFLATLDAM